jgi:hypothetical protein
MTKKQALYRCCPYSSAINLCEVREIRRQLYDPPCSISRETTKNVWVDVHNISWSTRIPGHYQPWNIGKQNKNRRQPWNEIVDGKEDSWRAKCQTNYSLWSKTRNNELRSTRIGDGTSVQQVKLVKMFNLLFLAFLHSSYSISHLF